MITIVCAIYKSERYLPNFIVHIRQVAQNLLQENFPFEILFVLTLPSPKEKELLAQIQNESWFRMVETSKTGLYVAWNEGVREAKGDIVGFWNADDIRFSKALLDARQLFSAGAELVHFPFRIRRYVNIFGLSIPIARRTIEKQIPEFSEATKKFFQSDMLYGPFFMFTKKLYEKVGPFDEQFKIAGDYDWCVRAAKLTTKIKKSRLLAGEFRVDGTGLSSGGKECLAVENNIIFKRHNLEFKFKDIHSSLSIEYHPYEIKVGESYQAYKG